MEIQSAPPETNQRDIPRLTKRTAGHTACIKPLCRGCAAVDDPRSDKVNRAIQQGLARCRASTAPIVALALFLDELRSDPLWREADILIVEKATRHILAQIVERQAR